MKIAQRCFLVLAVTIAVVVFCIPQRAEAGFVQNDPVNSVDPLGLWHGGDHERMTRDAWTTVLMVTEEQAYRADMASILVAENARVDSDFLAINYWHFNRGIREDIAAAIHAYVNNINGDNLAIRYDLDAPGKDNCKEALRIMGNLSHAYQDYYAHAIQRSSDGSTGIGSVTGNPGAPGANMKPASWGRLWPLPADFGEHGASEPGNRAPDTASRKSQAQRYTELEFQLFSLKWWAACKCFAKDIFGH